MGHPLGQVFGCEWLLHDSVVPHENTVEVRDSHDESYYQTCDHDQQAQQAHNQPSADGDEAAVVEEGCSDQDDPQCPIW